MTGLVSIDFETHLASNQDPIPKPVCLSFYDGKNEGLVAGSHDMEVKLKEFFAGDKIIIAHNFSFEALVIDHYFPALKPDLTRKLNRGQIVCTMIYEQLLACVTKFPPHKFDLASLVMNYFKEDISEDKKDPNSWRLRYSELDGVPVAEYPERARSYAIEDSIWAYKIYQRQKANPLDIKLSVAASFYLNKMGHYGIKVDKDRVQELKEELSAKLEPSYKKLEAAGLVSWDKKAEKYKKKMKILREYIQEHVEKPILTIKGTIATSAEHIETYLGHENAEFVDVLETYLNIMKYEKILTAFVSRLEQADPLIRTRYKAVVSSGRTSSSTSDNFPSVNIQQMPRDVPGVKWTVRNCFVPREGYDICSIDYAGLELASTAHNLWLLTGETDMLDTVNRDDAPVDMHSMLAYRIMNMKEGTKETYESFKANKKKEPYATYRQLAKPINLGFPGGIGYETMRSLLAKDGIYPKMQVLETSSFENNLAWKVPKCRDLGHPVRVRRSGFQEYQLVYDELVALKNELFDLYPDLKRFLTETHEDYLTGKVKKVKNEWGEEEWEPMYAFQTGDFKRDWCLYTQVCNGMLMQSPAAIGAKKAMVEIIQKYGDDERLRPLAFIHDEIVFEVRKDSRELIEDIADIMIREMQTVLSKVRIAVEAELFEYWAKSGGFWSKEYWRDPNSWELRSKE